MKIHIFGAAGAGATTLGQLLSERLGVKLVDVDELPWDHSTQPYSRRLSRAFKRERLHATTSSEDSVVLVGSVCGWGDKIVERFDAGVFLLVPTSERLKRITLRQTGRYGAAATEVGGEYHQQHDQLMSWAGLYDYSGPSVRSYAQHRQWMRKRSFPILTQRGVASTETLLNATLCFLRGEHEKKQRVTLDFGVDPRNLHR